MPDPIPDPAENGDDQEVPAPAAGVPATPEPTPAVTPEEAPALAAPVVQGDPVGQPHPDAVIAAFKALDESAKVSTSAAIDKATPSYGLYELDRKTRKMIWRFVFLALIIIAVGALTIIWHSYTVDITTTTGSGNTAVTSTTHPDVAAAWAVVSAIVAGIVGLLVPSPTAGGSGTGNPTP
jgi:hypothetical protein